jgi:thiamine-phosphate pyrophosphorylase
VTRRQTVPRQWLIVDGANRADFDALRRLARGSGVIVLGQANRRLEAIARSRGLRVAFESTGEATRIHNLAELRNALLRGVPLVLLSPVFATRSHPDWRPIPRMRASALARLASRRLLALGGMNAKRYAKIAPLGFIGWAGISAFRT